MSDTPIETLGLPKKVVNSLFTDSITTVERLCQKSVAQLIKLPNFGIGCLNEVESALEKAGLKLADSNDDVRKIIETREKRRIEQSIRLLTRNGYQVTKIQGASQC